MLDLPKPKLGAVTAVTITSPDLEKSLNYYLKLGFAEVMRADFPFPWIQISDGALLMMVRQDNTPYLALTYYVGNTEVIADLENQGIVFDQKPGDADMVKKYLFHSPDGLNISLVIADGFVQPPGPTMLRMPPQEMFKPDHYVNKTCGMFGELSHPVKNLEASIAFWERLGFKVLSNNKTPYPWAILSDGLAIVGLHQSERFNDPAITFFAADMKAKIEKLKALGLQDYKETERPGNIVLTTPEGQHVNLFGLGM